MKRIIGFFTVAAVAASAIPVSAALSLTIGVTARAEYVYEERYAPMKSYSGSSYQYEINTDGNNISTTEYLRAVSMGEDINRRYDGPSFYYDGDRIYKTTPSPEPTRAPEASAPTAVSSPSPEITETETEGGLSVMRKIVDRRDIYALYKDSKAVTEFKYDRISFLHDKSGKLLISATWTDDERNSHTELMDKNLKGIFDRGYGYVEFDDAGRMFAADWNGANRGVYLDGNYNEIKSCDEYEFKKLDKNHRLYIAEKIADRLYYLLDEKGREVYGPAGEISALGGGAYEAVIRNGGQTRCELINSDGKATAQSDGYIENYPEKNGYILCQNGKDGVETVISDMNGKELFRGKGNVDLLHPLSAGGYRTKMSQDGKSAVISEEGKLLTDFVYDYIWSETVSDGTVQTPVYEVDINDERKLLRSDFTEYDTTGFFYPTENPYWDYDFGDTVIKYWNGMQALIDKRANKYIIPYTSEYTMSKRGNYILRIKDNKQTSVLDKYGNVIFDFDEKILGVEDLTHAGARMLLTGEYYKFAVDENGNNIFGNRRFTNILPFGENKFLVQTDDAIGVFTRLDNLEAVETSERVYINGYEIPCYSVNGKTVIAAEQLGGYGFDIVWDAEKRRLDVTRNAEYYDIIPTEIPAKSEIGSHRADIFPTDITVYFNGERIGAYDINEYMLINPKDMQSDGISVTESDENVYINIDGLAMNA